MTWEYALIGLVVGIIIGAVAMRLVIVNYASNRRCSTNWKRIKLNWTSIAKSWLATLPAARNYWIPWRTTIASCISTWRKAPAACLPELSAEANPFRNRLAESEASNDQAPVQMPRDYSEGASACCVLARSATNLFFGRSIAPPLLSLPDYHLIWCLIVSRLKIQ